MSVKNVLVALAIGLTFVTSSASAQPALESHSLTGVGGTVSAGSTQLLSAGGQVVSGESSAGSVGLALGFLSSLPLYTSPSTDITPPSGVLLFPSSLAQGIDQVFGKGILPVIATVSDETSLKGFVLSFAPGASVESGYTTLATGSMPVSESVVARWDTTQLSGYFTLKLTARDAGENISIATATVYIGDPELRLVLQGNDQNVIDKPQGVAVDDNGNIYVASTGQNKVLKFGPQGTFVSSFDGRTSSLDENKKRKKGSYAFKKPMGLALDKAGNIYVADRNNNRVAILAPDGSVTRSIGRVSGDNFLPGSEPGEFNKPTAVAVSLDRMAIADRNNGRVQIQNS